MAALFTRAVAVLAVLASGCEPATHALHVDVRTDLAPGIEFSVSRVEIRASSATSTVIETIDHAAMPSEPFLRGQRVADVAGLPPGDYVVHVELLGVLSTHVVERTISTHLAGDLAITVVLTRSCRGVTCAGDSVCISGVCALPSCLVDTCTPECTTATTCPTAAACASVSCVAGSCFYAGVGGACPAGDWCNPESGCELLPSTPDAGMADGGACSCVGRACGDDGCGNTCGSCGASQSCSAGQCTSDPPDCSGLSCGASHDGTGGPDACGTCGSGTTCSGGSCVATPPDCSGLGCGPAHDGTGGPDACGTCGAGFTCSGGGCQCGGGGASCVGGSCCGSMVCTSGACCEPVQQACGSGCCPGRMCDASRGVCCVVIGDGCSGDAQCCGYPDHQCVSGACCAVVGAGCGRPDQCCSNSCVGGTCR